jgi:hypothetical protein
MVFTTLHLMAPVWVKINNSVIAGSTYTIANGSGVTYVGNSKLDGGPSAVFEGVTCAGVYDENYAFYASNCP